jgi:hypothetical protein
MRREVSMATESGKIISGEQLSHIGANVQRLGDHHSPMTKAVKLLNKYYI